MQEPSHTPSESSFVSLNQLLPPRPIHQPCPCCFDLDAASARQSDGQEIIWDQKESVVYLRRSLQAIEIASSSGCQICSVLLEVLVFFHADSPMDGEARNVRLKIPSDLGHLEVSFPSAGTKQYVQIYMSENKTWNRIQPLSDINTHHLSEESLSFIKSCLQTCLNDHTLCHQGQGDLPSRLLDIGHHDHGSIRLVDVDSVFSVKYIALSYCWGDAVSVKTTFDSLEKMKSGFSISELPQTYADAISLARELEIQYLWIDALCIIQDCHEDWEKESAKMAGIYTKAHLTIGAASSKSVTQPFLHRNDPNESQISKDYTQVFRKRIDDKQGSFLLKARLIPECGIHSKWQESPAQRLPSEPWSRRGWTLQEQLLSTRMLSFSLAEMQWTCQEAVLCECRSKLNHRRLFGQKPLSQIARASDAFRFWHKVVENYSIRFLTNPKDKLTAVSGIAAIIQQMTQSRYTAGLWVDNIDLGLLWRRAATPTMKPSRSEYIAPSFSWASIDGEVDYCCFMNGKWPYQKMASVVAVEASASHDAPLGRVESGLLTIRGPLTTGLIMETSQTGLYLVALGRIELEVFADTVLQHTTAAREDGSVGDTACRWSPLGSSQNASNNSGLEDAYERPVVTAKPDLPSSGVRCWALRLGSFPSATKSKSSVWRDHQLLILGKSPRDPENFERLGLASYSDREGSNSAIMELSKQEYETTVTLL